MLRNVFLDLDDTVFDFHLGEANALRETLQALGLHADQAICMRYSAINDAFWKALERGEITRQALLTRRFDVLFSEWGVKRDSMLAQQYYERALSAQHAFLPGAREFLCWAAEHKNLRLYAVTNGSAKIQRKRLHDAEIEQFFDAVLISEELGYTKPSTEFFDACFSRLPKDVLQWETVIIGDSLTSDMKGGKQAGLVTCWYCPHSQTDMDAGKPAEVDYMIHDLRDAAALFI
ncbi:MAG: YjjG family noncanonical pyrimidine nucleotidase [Clostridia bacterium]|nr:YjjG family noncanonical pyrimidine nucleotidase [Clostridia bacterium]